MIKIFSILLLLISCTTNKRQLLKIKFDEFQKSNNVWLDETEAKIKTALQKYSKGEVLKNGKIYGAFAKKINLQTTPVKKLIQLARDNDCQVITDYIRNWKTKEYFIYNAKKLPIIFLVCSDASLIRLKPQGNPLNKFRPWPHGSKSVRFTVDSDYRDFLQEAFKVDNEGNSIPKWPKSLNKDISADAWAEDAHTDLNNQ